MGTKNRKLMVVTRVEFSPSSDAQMRLRKVFDLLLTPHGNNKKCEDTHLNNGKNGGKGDTDVSRQQ